MSQQHAKLRALSTAAGLRVIAAACAWDADGSPEAATELKRAVGELRAAEARVAESIVRAG